MQNRESTNGIQGEKSSRNMASSRNLVWTIGAQASNKANKMWHGLRVILRSAIDNILIKLYSIVNLLAETFFLGGIASQKQSHL